MPAWVFPPDGRRYLRGPSPVPPPAAGVCLETISVDCSAVAAVPHRADGPAPVPGPRRKARAGGMTAVSRTSEPRGWWCTAPGEKLHSPSGRMAGGAQGSAVSYTGRSRPPPSASSGTPASTAQMWDRSSWPTWLEVDNAAAAAAGDETPSRSRAAPRASTISTWRCQCSQPSEEAARDRKGKL